MVPTWSEIQKRKPEITALGRKFGVSNIRVFGSVARGTANESSDIDLLIWVDAKRSLLDVIGFEQGVADLLGAKVDAVEEAALNPTVKQIILIEAKSL